MSDSRHSSDISSSATPAGGVNQPIESSTSAIQPSVEGSNEMRDWPASPTRSEQEYEEAITDHADCVSIDPKQEPPDGLVCRGYGPLGNPYFATDRLNQPGVTNSEDEVDWDIVCKLLTSYDVLQSNWIHFLPGYQQVWRWKHIIRAASTNGPGKLRTRYGWELAGAIEICRRLYSIRPGTFSKRDRALLVLSATKFIPENYDVRKSIYDVFDVVKGERNCEDFYNSLKWAVISCRFSGDERGRLATTHFERDHITDYPHCVWGCPTEDIDNPEWTSDLKDPEVQARTMASLLNEFMRRDFNSLRLETLAMVSAVEKISLSSEILSRMLVQMGDKCNSCGVLVGYLREHMSLPESDVPLRDWNWNPDLPPPTVNMNRYKDAVYNLSDWKYATLDSGRPTTGFRKNCDNFLRSALAELHLGDAVSKKEKKDILMRVRRSPYVIYMTEMRDELFANPDDLSFFSKLYELRTRLGLNGDYGYAARIPSMVAEGPDRVMRGPDEEDPGFYTWIAKLIGQARAKFGQLTLSGLVSSVVEKLVDGFRSMFGLINGIVNKVLDWIVNYVKNWIFDSLIVPEFEKFTTGTKFKEALTKAIAIMCLTMICLGGFIGSTMYRLIAAGISGLRTTSSSEFKAEADFDALPFVTTTVVGIVGLCATDASTLRNRCLLMSGLMAGGTALSKGVHLTWMLLPEALKTALVSKFAPETYQQKTEMLEWRSLSMALITASRTQMIIGSTIFYDKVTEVMKKGLEIIKKIKEPGLRAAAVQIYARLTNLMMVLNQRKYSKGSRKLPFAVHFTGPPGIGKTLVLPHLIRTAFGHESDTTYYRNVSDEFWNGYMSDKVIVMDEFLIGDRQRKTLLATEYLTLVSTAQFMPPMASTDNPSVGLKGTIAVPDVVITINNTAYNRPPDVDHRAFQRRRKCVIEMAPSDRFIADGMGGNVDMTKYTDEEISKFIWMKFRIRPGTWPGSDEEGNGPWMTYDILKDLMKTMFEDHNAVATNLARSLGGEMAEEDDPQKVLGDIMRDCFGIPNGPMSVKDALYQSFFGVSMKAEGPSTTDEEVEVLNLTESGEEEVEYKKVTRKRKKSAHSHNCCNGSFIHRKKKGWTCPVCGKKQDCEPAIAALDSPIDYSTPTPDQQHDPTHTGLDPTYRHRHHCLVPSCTRSVPHKGPEQKNHYCKDHIKDEPILEKYLKALNETESNNTRVSRERPPCMTHDEYRTAIMRLVNADYNFCWAMYLENTPDDTTNPDDFLKQQFVGTLTSTVIFCVLFSIAGYLRSRDQPDKVTFTAQSPKKDDERKEKAVKTKPHRGFKAQGPGLPLFNQQLDVTMTRASGERVDKTIRVVPLKDKWILTFLHAIEDGKDRVENGSTMTLTTPAGTFPFQFFEENMVCNVERDWALIYVTNNQCPAFKDITKKFVSQQDLQGLKMVGSIIESETGLKYTTAKRVINRSYRNANAMIELAEAWQYSMLTGEGDCGSLLVCSTGQNVNKILGMHVAGSSDKINVPQGLATIVIKEELEEAMELVTDAKETDFKTEGPVGDLIRLGANCVKYEVIKQNEVIHLPRKSKIQPSLLQKKMSRMPQKHLPILRKEDPRSNGWNPVVRSVEDTLSTSFVDIDEARAFEIFNDICNQYKRKMKWPAGKRHLTFDEACKGIPGILASLRTGTSAGYPLVHTTRQRGKTEFIRFVDGEFEASEEIKKLVDFKIHEMRTYERKRRPDGTLELDHVFLGYLKDELISESKLKECRIRMIYANDMICLIAFRMLYGSLLAALNQSFEETPSAIGMNQYSYDMHRIYDYLTVVGKNFVAGDYKSFDKRLHPTFRDFAYWIIGELADGLHVGNSFQFMLDHETESPAQVNEHRFWTISNHMSGCFWTTIVNNFANEGYMRWVFGERHPTFRFEEHCRMKVLGDDHVLCVSDQVDMTPDVIGPLMAKIGQEYTSAEKGQPLEDHYLKFEEVMFLGARPRVLNGQWTGAMKKDTLFECVQWTKDKNKTLVDTCKQMIECASQWDKQFFEEYVNEIERGLELEGIEIEVPAYGTLSRIVANRDAYSGYDYVTFNAQGPPERPTTTQPATMTHMTTAQPLHENVAPAVPGLTTIKTSTMAPSESSDRSNLGNLADKAINEKALDMNYGLEGLMFRMSVEWLQSQARGSLLANIAIPFGLLALNNVNNIQNMAFQRFIYSVMRTELVIQVSGLPTQQGALLAYFTPLSNSAIGIMNATLYDGATIISPKQNTTSSVVVPFRHYRSALNTYAGGLGEESLGNFMLQVLSPLSTFEDEVNCTVTIYSRFEAKMTIARPLPDGESDMISQRSTYRVGYAKKLGDLSLLKPGPSEFRAEGANYSHTSYEYNVSHVGGDVPIQGNKTDTDQSAEGSLSVPTPMDNPPLVSGGVPMMPQFSGLSKSNGLEPTVALNLHPQQMFREHLSHFDPDETKIESIMNRRGFLRAFDFSNENAEGEVLLTLPLNSVLMEWEQAMGAVDIPAHIAFLNQFLFWRGDFVLSFYAVRTGYQNGRLAVTSAYGAPGITPGEENIFLNQIIEFNEDNDWGSVTIPFNAATEFLRTYNGPSAVHQVQNYSLGSLMVTVRNRLRVTSQIVSDTIEVLVFVSMKNVRVYEARPYPTCAIHEGFPNFVAVAVPPVRHNPIFVAEGPGESGVQAIDHEQADQLQIESTEMTATETKLVKDIPCKLDIGRKFEYCVTTINELVRRHGGFFDINQNPPPSGNMVSIDTRPFSQFRHLFAGWAGTLKYRLYYESNISQVKVGYIPTDGPDPEAGFIMTPGLSDNVYDSQTPDPGELQIFMNNGLTNYMANEMMFPLGTSAHAVDAVTDGVHYIDVSIPFNTIYNFHPTTEDTFHSIPPRTGVVTISTRGAQSLFASHWRMYQAVGDDFSFGIWRPPPRSVFSPYAAAPDLFVRLGTNLGGFEF